MLTVSVELWSGQTRVEDMSLLFQVHSDGTLPAHVRKRSHLRLRHPQGHGRRPRLPGHVSAAQRPLQRVSERPLIWARPPFPASKVLADLCPPSGFPGSVFPSVPRLRLLLSSS